MKKSKCTNSLVEEKLAGDGAVDTRGRPTDVPCSRTSALARVTAIRCCHLRFVSDPLVKPSAILYLYTSTLTVCVWKKTRQNLQQTKHPKNKENKSANRKTGRELTQAENFSTRESEEKEEGQNTNSNVDKQN